MRSGAAGVQTSVRMTVCIQFRATGHQGASGRRNMFNELLAQRTRAHAQVHGSAHCALRAGVKRAAIRHICRNTAVSMFSCSCLGMCWPYAYVQRAVCATRARQHAQSICSKTVQARVALGCVACRCLRASCWNTSLVAATADMRQQLRSAASTLSRARRAERRGPYNARGCFVALSIPEFAGGDVLMAA